MQKFFAALGEAKLTSAEMLKHLTSPQIVAAPAKSDSPELDYGFGFGVGEVQGHRWYGHNGSAPGVNVEAAVFPGDRAAVVVMSNRDPPAASRLFREVRSTLFEPDQAKSCLAAD